MNLYQTITQQMIEKLKKGCVPWQSPYLKQMSIISKKPYRGINRLILSMKEYKSPYWITFPQAKNLNARIRKGEKSTKIIFYQLVEELRDEKTVLVPELRFYSIFNLEQVEGLEIEKSAPSEMNPFDYLCDYAEIEHGNYDVGCYIPSQDKICMPYKERFVSEIRYLKTLFHEMTHSTGHVSRCNRFTDKYVNTPNQYSREELTAEMGASFLCSEFGILEETIDNSAAYIQSWLSTLENNPEYLFQAASAAEQAVEYLMGETFGQKLTKGTFPHPIQVEA